MTPKKIQTILLVDNDPFFITSLSEALSGLGYQILNAQDGVEALAILHKTKPDCIILDWIMPKIDGEKVCRYMQQHSDLQKIPIIILSAVAQENLPKDAIQFASAVLIKEQIDRVFHNIKNILDFLSTKNQEDSLEGHAIEEKKRIKSRRVVKELLSQTKFHETVLNHIANGILVTDQNGIIIFANSATENLLNKNELELIGKKLDGILPEIQYLSLLKKGSSHEPDEQRFNKGQKYLRALGTQLSEDNNVLGLLIILIDQTEEKNIEKEQQRFKESLEKEVTMRTEELEKINQRLKEANLELEHASKMKSEFLANMSHELRSPLNDILGFTQLLDGRTYGEITHKQEEAVQLISDSAHVLLNHINSILDFSKLEAGEDKISKSEFSFSDLIQEIAKAYQHLLRGRPIKLKVQLGHDIPHLLSDRDKIRQIMTNLIHNSIKFTKRGTIKITTEKEKNNRLQIVLEDTGIGIDKKHQEIIFDAFRQVDGSSTREYEGTGLGLAITKKLLNLLEGEIHLKSSPGVGSTFRISLPIRLEG